MHRLANLGIQTSRRFRFYSNSLKLGERVNSEIWGSPGSRQLLQLQQIPKIPKNCGTLLLLGLVLFYSLIWSNDFFRMIFKCLVWSTTHFRFSSNAWNNPLFVQIWLLPLDTFSACLNRKFIWLVLPPLRRNNESWLRLCFWYVCFTSAVFGFYIDAVY